MPNKKLTRRTFNKTAIAASTLFTAPAFLRGRNLNEKLDIAVIGTGGRGGSNLRSVESENIVAVCDVNQTNLKFAQDRHPNAQSFQDFRKLYDSVKQFDAVVVSTCEHTHAFATLPALQMKKHVYCEKPLTYNIAECRRIRNEAKKANVATQMGTQIHAGSNYRRVVELVQSGAIGKISECHVWVGRAWGRQSQEDAQKHRDIVFARERPKQADNIPTGLDWDLWLGPAPERAFNNVYFPGPKWYRWWDFGNGTMSDLGSHWVDLPFWALGLQTPSTISATGPESHAELAPASMTATYTYEKTKQQPGLKLHWYQGTYKPQVWMNNEIPQWGSGVLFVGSKGMLLSDYGKHVLLPEEKFQDFKRPDPSIPDSIGHHQEWVHACKTGAPTTCNFEYSGLLTEANHLGNVAYRAGKTLYWDSEKMEVTNHSDAERFIHREYRKGWSLG